jgi:multiple sugar transport system permease protein
MREIYFARAFRTIGLFTLVTVPVELLLGFVAAWLLREPFPARGLVRVLLLIPWLISPVASGVMWRFLYASGSGILNYALALFNLPLQPSPLGVRGLALPAAMIAEIWRKTPLVSFLLVPGLISVPSHMWQQATLEGASILHQVRHIGLPWLRSILLPVAMFLAGDALGTFDGVLMLTGGGPGAETLTPALYSYQRAFQLNNWPLGASSAWVIALATMLLGTGYLLLMRREARE